MEGIAGIVYPDVFQTEQLIQPMLDTMSHRGGINNETFTFKNFQIGITGGKLATNAKKNIHIAFSGNFNNVESIYAELIHQGGLVHHKDTPADMLVHAYELWGSDLIRRIEGDFAILILDQHKEKLILARDRIGKKPLYWYQDQHYFIFASELKALMATECIPQTPSLEAIASYLYFGYIPQDMAPINGVNKLLPGHILKLNQFATVAIQQYWSYWPFFKTQVSETNSAIVRHIDELLKNAVKGRLPKDENIGCFISGGLGSACIAHYLADLGSRERISSYTVGFEGQNEEDIKAAEEAAQKLGISHDTLIITPDQALDSLVPIVWHLDEPIADPNVLAIWRMARMSAAKVKTVFSGMCSDELLAGHSRYTREEQRLTWSDSIERFRLFWARKLLLPVLNYISPRRAFHLMKKARTNPWQFEYLQHNALFPEGELAAVAPKIAELFDPEVFLHKFHNLGQISSPVSSFLYFDVKTRLADCFILEMERLTAAHGQYWIPPFLDRHLVEFLAGVPEDEKLSGTETALLLKKLLAKVYPPAFLNRPKQTRQGLLAAWVGRSDLLATFKLLQQGSLIEAGLISEQWLQEKLRSVQTIQDSFNQLWAVLILEIWYRLNINRPIQLRAPNMSVRELLLEK